MGACEGPSCFHIVMEFFEGKNLQDIIFTKQNKQYTLNLVKKYKIAKQIVTAMKYIHCLNPPIIHRDIKPSNIMVNSNLQVKICDLGLSKSDDLKTDLLSTVVGTLRGTLTFMSPELLLNEESPSIQSDVWAVGVTLVELYSGKAAWILRRFSILEDIKEKFKNRNIPPNITKLPDGLQSGVKGCFEYEKEKRITMSELYTYFKN
ncbi:receptor-interacting serine/threonine-protein kinase 3-like [Copidosoma floridanum]|uniref:receptor-interacting serine/threonine-protein kinase 3-like n=1 Tax=Copidosoma floridanum TaxID=29053 RepID=UPI000C6F67A2|nr:receptor-interacting serine/threonine-protein kinase 3-like [Copidosoma floridanum]